MQEERHVLDLGTTEFYLRVPSVSKAQLSETAIKLFDDWDAHIRGAVALPDYSLRLQLEEGSIKGLGAVGAIATAIYIGIGNYGDFISGLKTINEQLATSRNYLASRASRLFSCPEEQAVARRRGGQLAALQKLFHRVQRGELTPSEASVLAEGLLGADAQESPELLRELKHSLYACPKFHQQIDLPFGDAEQIEGAANQRSRRPAKPGIPPPEMPPPPQLRIEVWRESKDKKKKTRVSRV
jgi:hypothetical protein